MTRSLLDLSPDAFDHAAGRPRRRSEREVQAEVGFSPPGGLADRMHALQSSAAALDAAVRANVQQALFQATWHQWFAGWTAFFRRYQDASFQTMGAYAATEDPSAEVEAYASELSSWYDGYALERRSDGVSLPKPKVGAPDAPPAKRWGLPWWAWMVGGVAVAGGAYYVTRKLVKGLGSATDAMKGALGMRDLPAAPRMALPAPRPTIMVSALPSLPAAPARAAADQAVGYLSSIDLPRLPP